MMYVIINERGAVFGPFHSSIEAVQWANAKTGVEHGWRMVQLIKPTPEGE